MSITPSGSSLGLTLVFLTSLASPGDARGQALPAPLDEAALQAGQQQLVAARRPLYGALLAGGAASLIAGVGLLIPSRDDQSLRVAGAVTAGFGAINLVLGTLALRGLEKDDNAFRQAAAQGAQATLEGLRAARDELLRQRQQETVLFGVNLGLDVTYAAAGAAALLYGRSGPAHAGRWRAAGAALLGQGLFLLGIDLAGLLLASTAHSSLLPAPASLRAGRRSAF